MGEKVIYIPGNYGLLDLLCCFSFHPYLFFNRDHVSVTFLGFKIPPDGNLVDPKNDEVIETGLMTEQLRDGLTRQRVNFDEDYNSWNKLVIPLALL